MGEKYSNKNTLKKGNVQLHLAFCGMLENNVKVFDIKNVGEVLRFSCLHSFLSSAQTCFLYDFTDLTFPYQSLTFDF